VDALFVGLVLVFFLLCRGFVRLCEKL